MFIIMEVPTIQLSSKLCVEDEIFFPAIKKALNIEFDELVAEHIAISQTMQNFTEVITTTFFTHVQLLNLLKADQDVDSNLAELVKCVRELQAPLLAHLRVFLEQHKC
jgi:hypothetical protein